MTPPSRPREDVVSDRNAPIVAEFRANAGRVGGYFAEIDLLLLTSTGARSGTSYTHPLSYSRDGRRYVVIAADGGAPAHPGWYYNLIAQPEVTVEVGTEKFAAWADLAIGAERERLFRERAQAIPALNDYQARTTREIPVFTIERT
jgi:deazaflavin-dependent oxidoreductase (nitroreductase family)